MQQGVVEHSESIDVMQLALNVPSRKQAHFEHQTWTAVKYKVGERL